MVKNGTQNCAISFPALYPCLISSLLYFNIRGLFHKLLLARYQYKTWRPHVILTFSNPIIWVQSLNWRLPVTFHVVYTRHYLVNTPNWDATDAKHRGLDPDLLGSMLSDYTLGPVSNEKTKEQAIKKNCFRAAKGHGIRNIFFFAPWSDHRIYISPKKLLSLSAGTFHRSKLQVTRYFPQNSVWTI